jgi:glycosyltransferase involved in cell wall biosynthesis
MINYSIVIPHKNTPDLLQYCLDSIPVRDDVQVIVVDDNSDADKVDFEHFPHWKGENYEYYLTKKSGGTGFAENVGIGQAKGRWVIFVGADDYLLPSANAVFDEEKDTEADMVFFRPTAVLLDDRSSFSKRADQYNAIIDRYFVSGDETELRCRYFSICGRMIRREMIMEKDIRFDEIRYSNDNLFAVKIGVGAGKIEVRDKNLYCITESDHTLTSNFMKKPGELQIRSDAFFRAQMVLHEHAYPVDEESALNFLRLLFSEDREAFVLNFNRMRRMRYKKSWLIHEVFKGDSRRARLKHSCYAFVITWF